MHLAMQMRYEIAIVSRHEFQKVSHPKQCVCLCVCVCVFVCYEAGRFTIFSLYKIHNLKCKKWYFSMRSTAATFAHKANISISLYSFKEFVFLLTKIFLYPSSSLMP